MKVFRVLFLSLCVFFTLFMVFVKGTKKVRRYYSNQLNEVFAKRIKGKPCHEKPFVIIIPSYNNVDFCEKNLSSVFSQNYENYRIIYIDDASTDKTFETAKSLVEQHGQENRCSLLHNVENKKMLYNVYYAIHCCQDEEIIFVLDGDDWFAHPDVLKKLNKYYQNEDVWLTYGTYVTYPRYERGLSRCADRGQLLSGKLRKKSPWIFSQPRTFYAGLFKSIHLKDLLDPNTGDFYPSAGDVALMFPMLEMAREHSLYLSDVLYIYNRDTPLNDDKVRNCEQKEIESQIRSQPIYSALQDHPAFGTQKYHPTHIVIHSHNQPMLLLALLESIKKYVEGYNGISVIYQSDKPSFERGYQKVKEFVCNEAISWIPFTETQRLEEGISEKNRLMSYLFSKQMTSEFLCVLSDYTMIKSSIDLQEHAHALFRSGADQSVLSLNSKRFMEEDQTSCGALVSIGFDHFVCRHSSIENTPLAEMALMRNKQKSQLTHWFPRISRFFMKPKREYQWVLCHQKPPAIETNIPVVCDKEGRDVKMYSEEELNQRLLEGEKIDLEPFYHMHSLQDRIDLYPRFVEI